MNGRTLRLLCHSDVLTLNSFDPCRRKIKGDVFVITLNRRNPNDVILELGGGSHPLVHPRCMGGRDVNVDVRTCHNAEGRQTTDFTHDFNEPFGEKLTSDEFDQVVSQYCLEHVSWRKVRQFISEMLRVLKPGGSVLVVTSNTRKQFQWIVDHPQGWDGKDLFESASGVIFGDHDYMENSHRSFFDPDILTRLFLDAGFTNVQTKPYGERDTDVALIATKPGTVIQSVTMREPNQGEAEMIDKMKQAVIGFTGMRHTFVSGNILNLADVRAAENLPKPILAEPYTREEMFDKHYFNGGGKVGGYAREGYRDFPVHELTVRHIMMRAPTSVLEIGAARGYIGKRLIDRGVEYKGLEISRHCWMTRVCNDIIPHDICKTPWPFAQRADDPSSPEFDLSFSIATLEHIPEQYLDGVLKEMGKLCKRHLHAIDFGENDDGFDKTHVTLKDRDWWRTKFSNLGLTNYEIVNKEELERWHGEFPQEVLKGDDKVKLNLGSFTTMFHYGWINIDGLDVSQYAGQGGYRFVRHDLRTPMPFKTGDVHLMFLSHFLEHLTFEEGANLLKECRRVLHPQHGAMRIIVPDAALLMELYVRNPDQLAYYAEINDGVEKATTPLGKLHALLHNGHQSVYDYTTLAAMLEAANLKPSIASLGKTNVSAVKQILKETTEIGFELSLFVDAFPITA